MVKQEGKENDLLSRIAEDPAFGLSLEELSRLLHPQRFIGRSKEQVEEFLKEEIRPFLAKHRVESLTRAELIV